MRSIFPWLHCKGLAKTNCRILQDLSARRIIHRQPMDALSDKEL
jgi:hypothetical protein